MSNHHNTNGAGNSASHSYHGDISDFNQGSPENETDTPTPEELERKYPTTFNEPKADEDFARNSQSSPDAEALVKDQAEATFDKSNPTPEKNIDTKKANLQQEIALLEDENITALKERKGEKAYEAVESKNPKIQNQFFSWFLFFALAKLLVSGIFMLASTIAVTITQSDKVPLAYDYPQIAVLFAFLPLGGMFIISQAYDDIENPLNKNRFLWSLYSVSAIMLLLWAITFQSAYAEQVLDEEDVSTSAGFNFFALHISLQLIGEIMFGGLLKIGLHKLGTKYRETVSKLRTAYENYTNSSISLKKQLAPLLMEVFAIEKHQMAREASKTDYVNRQLGILIRLQNEAKFHDELATSAAKAAEMAKKYELKNANGKDFH